MDPQEQEVVGYEDYKSIKDRPPSPFLAPNKGGIIDDELDLDKAERQSFQDTKPDEVDIGNERSEERNSNEDLRIDSEFSVPTRRRSGAYNDTTETYTADDFVTAYDEQRVIQRPPNAEIYPDAELKDTVSYTPRDSETKDSNKPVADTRSPPLDTSFREVQNTPSARTRESSVSRERSVSSTGGSLDIHSVIGKDGVRMFNALLAAARKDVGLKRAWQLKADIFKCMIKTKLLVDSNKIQPEALEPFKEPLNNLGNLFLQLLADKKKYSFEESSIKPTLFATLCNQLGQMWNKLLEPHMDAMDLAKGQAVVEFLSAPKFIATFLSDSDFVEEKKMMKIHARRILKSKLKPTCVKSKCTKARLAGWSRYCPAHHLARFEHLYEPPNFESFVKGDETAEFLSFHSYFVDLIFEAPPGLGGPPINPAMLPPVSARHSLSGSTSPNTALGTSPGSPLQNKQPVAFNTSDRGFALNPENNLSPRQRPSVISQERSLLGNPHGMDGVPLTPGSPNLGHRPSVFSSSSADPSSPKGNGSLTNRPSIIHNIANDRNSTDIVATPILSKRPSLAHASPTNRRPSDSSTPPPPPPIPSKRPSLAHISATERTVSALAADQRFSESSTPLPTLSKRPSLPHLSTTERNLGVMPADNLPGATTATIRSHSDIQSRTSPVQPTRMLRHSRGLSVNVATEHDGSTPNSPTIATRPVLTSVNSNERMSTSGSSETTTLHSSPTSRIVPERSLAVHVDAESKGSQALSADKSMTTDAVVLNSETTPAIKSPREASMSPLSESRRLNETSAAVSVDGNAIIASSENSHTSSGDRNLEMSRQVEIKATSSEIKIASSLAKSTSGSITTLNSRQGSEVPNLAMHTDWNKRLLHLYLDLLRLQACNTVKDRGAVSKQIFDKYLHPDSPNCVNLWRHPSVEYPLPKLTRRVGAVHPLLVPINTAIEGGLAAVQPGVFMPLCKFIEGILRTAFEGFVTSAKYKERLEQFRLPEQFVAALDDKQAEKESEDRLWEESCVVRFDPQLEYIDPVNYSTLPS